MWHFEFSNGYKSKIKTYTKRETLYWASVYFRWEIVSFQDEDKNDIPDIYIYYNDDLDEIIKGVDLL